MADHNRLKNTKTVVLYAVILLATASAVPTSPGCLPTQKDRAQGSPAPIVDTETPHPDQVAWRRRFTQNRIEPADEFRLFPAPPRDNRFGEFDDNLFFGLDSQPALPNLPGDTAIMPPPGKPATYSMAAPNYPKTHDGSSTYPPTSAPATDSITPPLAPGSAGIAADGRFYPLEQLVYGGDYPDIDRPDAYRLMPRDVISVAVRDHPEFSGTLTVQADGTVRIPNAHDLVRVRGLTVDETAEEIRRTLAPYIRGETIVRVQANRARGGYYFVFGDVRQPGRFPMGMEPIRLSDAVLAANWEANPDRLDKDEELGPSFPAASPRGRYLAPRSADMARVMLITPHRSRPARTSHDVRQALMGMTGDDPAVRPGQIVVVPSLDPEKNRALGLEPPGQGAPPPGLMPGQGFSTGDSSARLPEVTPPADPGLPRRPRPIDPVELNLSEAFEQQHNTEPAQVPPFPGYEVCDENGECEVHGEHDPHNRGGGRATIESPIVVESVDPAVPPRNGNGWKKGF